MDDHVTIDDPEALSLLRAAAARTGRSEAEVLREALRALAPAPADDHRILTAAELDALLAQDQASVIANPISVEELLYGDDGMPR